MAGTGGPLILQVTEYPGGPLIDLASTPTITITNLNTSTIVVGPTSVGITHPSTGVYIYLWSAAVDQANYLAVWDGTPTVGSPLQSSELVTVYASSGHTVGPCGTWDLSEVCCAGWDEYSDALQAQASRYATMVLWSATGRQFGECPITVRPCGRFCRNCPTGYYWDSGTWLPYIFNGLWYNCWCGAGAGCQNCDPHCMVYLPGPVKEIVQVTLGGEVLDPSEYFVWNNVWLVRVNTEDCWPLSSDQNLAPDDPDAFTVSYIKGTAVPAALLDAAGTLACEYAKACLGQECALPGRVSSIARQGVSVNMVDVDTLLKSGLTGIKTVDDVIRALNPNGLLGRTRFYSPDVPEPGMITWP